MKYEMKVKIHSGYLHVRNKPGMNGKVVGRLYKDDKVIATQLENGWYKHDKGGWSNSKYLVLVKDLGGGNAGSSNAKPKPAKEKPKLPPLSKDELKYINTIFDNGSINSDKIDKLNYVLGVPYHFTNLTDPRPDKSDLGRVYMDTFLSDMSMLVLTPGKAAFMKNFSKSASNEIMKRLVGSDREEEGENDSSLSDILEGKETGRYYSFESDYAEYIKYVNNMCRLSAILLGIGDVKLYGKKLKDFDWDLKSLQGESSIFNFLTTEKSVSFMIDGKNSSFSEGMNSSTRESKMAGVMNSGSDLMREGLFLFGKGYSDKAILDTSKHNYESAVNKVLKTLMPNDTLAKQTSDRISDHATTIVNGGVIAFPEIYSDSSYNKSYDCVIKLATPYPTPLGFYLDILVPMWFLVAMTYPRQLGANGYTNPFLIRGFCKGWFTCSLGIIDSMTIKKASEDGWATNGLPTEVEISFSIKDLYENLAISRFGDFSTFHNIEFIDMLAGWTGVNMNKPEVTRKIAMYQTFLKNSITEFFPNISAEVQQQISNKIIGMLK